MDLNNLKIKEEVNQKWLAFLFYFEHSQCSFKAIPAIHYNLYIFKEKI